MSESKDHLPVWKASFTEKVRQEQLQDDSAAWNAVTGLLLTIIGIGLTLALFTVWACS